MLYPFGLNGTLSTDFKMYYSIFSELMAKVLVEQPLDLPGFTKYRVAKRYENTTNGHAKTRLLGYNI